MSEFVAGKCGRYFFLLGEFTMGPMSECGRADKVCHHCKRILELERDLDTITMQATEMETESKRRILELGEENKQLRAGAQNCQCKSVEVWDDE